MAENFIEPDNSFMENITLQLHKVSRVERSGILGSLKGNSFRGCTVWFTGLSGAGKTTIAFAVESALVKIAIPAYALDGDNLRHGLCKNLSFSEVDRSENIRRVAEVAKMFGDMGVVALASFISPFKRDRNAAREIHEQANIPFFEVFVNTPLDICESRDPKNLYKKARAGKLKGFTGIDSVYESPEEPDLILNAGTETPDQCIEKVMDFLCSKGIIWHKFSHGKLSIRELFMDHSVKELLELRLANIPKINISRIDLEWLQVLAEGWASPLYGFMRERQYLQCLHHGVLWDLKCGYDIGDNESRSSSSSDAYLKDLPISQSIPIVLPITDVQRDLLLLEGNEMKETALVYNGKEIAILSDGEIYAFRKEEHIARVFGTTLDIRHPVIDNIMMRGNWLLGGDIQVIERIKFNDGLDEYRLTPQELRNRFEKANCDAIFAFQLRNPIHNGHALLMKETREKLLENYRNPMLLLHPLGGWLKDDDVPLNVRIEQHKAVLEEGVLDPNWTVLSIFPSPMSYAGPTEVQWHARGRLAAGVQFYIVGRDPAGISHPDTGDYLYDPAHGAKVLTMTPYLPSLTIIPFRVAAYDKVNAKMAFFDESRKEDFFFISGTKMRAFARDNIAPPDGFMSPKAWKVLASYYIDRAK